VQRIPSTRRVASPRTPLHAASACSSYTTGLGQTLRYCHRELPELLLACVREAEFADRLPRYDALVVDEAQGHDTAFAQVAELGDLACGGGGHC